MTGSQGASATGSGSPVPIGWSQAAARGATRTAAATTSQLAGERYGYYGKPIVKEPTWRWFIPTYLFVGGLAGASAPLALAAKATGNRPLARTALAGAFVGTVISPVLLIADLRDPKRFLNMLRLFKVTSPMSIGSWILTAFGTSTGLAALSEVSGIAPTAGTCAGAVAALCGPLLSTYTSALISDTAIPAWHEARRELPFVFAGGSLASAGAFALVGSPTLAATLARRVLLLGVAIEFVALEAMRRRLGPLLYEPFERGTPALLKRIALVTMGCSAGLAVSAKRRRAAAVAAGLLGLASACCERFSIFEAGKASARDPKYVVLSQRARIERARATSAAEEPTG